MEVNENVGKIQVLKNLKDIMTTKQPTEAQNPLILRCNRLIDAFAKSDDERDFYLDRREGFLIYADLDKPEEDLHVLEKELKNNAARYCMIPKLTFYETKKIMEGFINEKVYDIDTKEKLMDVIQSKEAREHFLEFIYDHHSELEKWQTFYQERSRIRIIEWLRTNNIHFVFEEDLELPRLTIEKLKKELFQTKVGKDTQNARKALFAKAKTYYSNEALNPRPKRGRPPKQTQKTEIEPQITTDIYTTVPNGLLGFLFIPDLANLSASTFSSKFGNEGDLFSQRKPLSSEGNISIDNLNMKLQELRGLTNKWNPIDEKIVQPKVLEKKENIRFNFDEDEDEDEDEDDFNKGKKGNEKLNSVKKDIKKAQDPKKTPPLPITKSKTKAKAPVPEVASTPPAKPKPAKKSPPKPAKKAAKPTNKPKVLRPMIKLKRKAK